MAPLLASATAGLLLGATLLGQPSLAGAVLVAQALVVLGLTRGSDVPASRTSGVVAAVVGAATTALVTVVPQDPPQSADLVAVAAAPGVALVAVAVVQLTRRDGRGRLTASVTFGVTAVMLVVAPVLWLALWTDVDGLAALLLALAGAATAAAFAVFPGPALLWVVGGTIAAAGVGLVAQAAAPQVDEAGIYPGPASVLAAAARLAAAAGLWLARLCSGPSPTPPLLTAALPLSLAAPVTYAVAGLFAL